MASASSLDGCRCLLGAATVAAGRGGIARVARLTARALVNSGAALAPISYLDQGPLELAGFPVVCAAGSKLRFAALSQLNAMRSKSFVYDSAGIARAHPHLLSGGAGYAVWMHGVEAWEHLRPGHAAVFRRAALVVVNSHHTLERYRALHGDLPQAAVCWLATEEDEAPPPRPPRLDAPVVLILSRVDAGDAYKGHRELIEAWPSVLAAVPGARLLIAGGGSGLADIERLARSSGIAHSTELCGFVPEAELQTLWQRADVFAMPSRGEGFGLVYVEAMRQGIPIIASVHDAGHEINVDGKTGYNVDLGQPSQLAARLTELIAAPQLRRRMGEAGRARWRQHFRYSAFRDRLMPLLGCIAGTSRA